MKKGTTFNRPFKRFEVTISLRISQAFKDHPWQNLALSELKVEQICHREGVGPGLRAICYRDTFWSCPYNSGGIGKSNEDLHMPCPDWFILLCNLGRNRWGTNGVSWEPEASGLANCPGASMDELESRNYIFIICYSYLHQNYLYINYWSHCEMSTSTSV